ncbi:MAG: hypothetical protein U0X91_27450 [Spirosomataceae bacterium]
MKKSFGEWIPVGGEKKEKNIRFVKQVLGAFSFVSLLPRKVKQMWEEGACEC